MAAGESSSSAIPVEDEGEREFLPGFQTFEDYSKALVTQVMQATKSANSLPVDGDDFDYYSSFPGFKTFCGKMGSRINRTIARVLKHQNVPCYWPTGEGGEGGVGVEERFETLVEANDILLERVTMLLDEASGVKKNEEPILPPSIQQGRAEVASWNTKRDAVRGQMGSYKFIHARNVPRPQLKFRDKVDNGNTPFIPVIRHKPHALQPLPQIFQKLQNPTTLNALIDNTKEWSLSEERFSHPYQYELNNIQYMEEQLQLKEPQSPGSLEDTPLTFVTSLEQLEALKKELMSVTEFAVDLEHHSYRSFLGFVCLMQVSTRTHDYIVDTLEVRHHMHILLEVFANPSIVKVLHGADMDIQWLQRDFGLYVVNMFDTGQASRVLSLPKYSLAFLLHYCCNIQVDKQFQLADWRIRPLPPELINYAREDTHYLLYVYDRMRNELIRRGNKHNNFLHSVLDRSRDVCLKRYIKPMYSETGYYVLYQKHKRRFNAQQLHCLKLLYAWRDHLARDEDESTGYVLPNHMLFQISEILPREAQGVLACCNPIPTLLRQQLQEVSMLVQQARDYKEELQVQTPINVLGSEAATVDIQATMEDTDGVTVEDDMQQLPCKPKATGPPVNEAIPVLSIFPVKQPKISRSSQQQLDEIRKSFPNLLDKFVSVRSMAPIEVLQQHMSSDTPITSSNKPLPLPSPSLPATPTSNKAGTPGRLESKTPDVETVAPPVKKRKISVREMGKRHSEPSVATDINVTRKKPRLSGKNEDNKDFKPFQYEGTNFTDFTKDTSSSAKPIDLNSEDRGSKKKKQFTNPRSRVHQRSGERSHTYSRSKRPSWPG